jgi:hypothetical protein
MIELAFLLSGGAIGYYSGSFNSLGDDIKTLQPTVIAGSFFVDLTNHYILKEFLEFLRKLILE